MSKGATTTEERAATAASGQPAAEGWDKDTEDQKDNAVYAVEELAAMFVAIGGKDPRALAVFAAGQKAGRIDKNGSYIGPTADSRGEDDDEGIVEGLPTTGGLTSLAAHRKDAEEVTDEEISRLLRGV